MKKLALLVKEFHKKNELREKIERYTKCRNKSQTMANKKCGLNISQVRLILDSSSLRNRKLGKWYESNHQ